MCVHLNIYAVHYHHYYTLFNSIIISSSSISIAQYAMEKNPINFICKENASSLV